MKRSTLCLGLLAGAMGMTGCHQAAKTESVAKTIPDDPSSWTGKEVSRAEPDSDSPKSGLPKSSRLQGMLSSEARDIENSLGVVR